jgi:hypothetical protein
MTFAVLCFLALSQTHLTQTVKYRARLGTHYQYHRLLSRSSMRKMTKRG